MPISLDHRFLAELLSWVLFAPSEVPAGILTALGATVQETGYALLPLNEYINNELLD